MVYLVEMLVKLCVLGPIRYASSKNNLFDGFVTIASLVTAIIVVSPGILDSNNIVRVLVLFRVLRFLRLIGRVPGYRALIGTYVAILPVLSRPVLPICVGTYFFAELGMSLFGGLLYPANPRLIGSFYGNAGYYFVSTFNDFWSAWSTLFQLVIVNNWFVIASGSESATTDAARVYFCAWWLLGFLAFVNLFVALLLEGFSRTPRSESIWRKRRVEKKFLERQEKAPAASTSFDVAIGGASQVINLRLQEQHLVATKHVSVYDILDE